MIDFRPIGHVVGLLVMMLGITMLIPCAVDLLEGDPDWTAFLESAVVTSLVGATLTISCANGVGKKLGIRETFLITTLVWVALPFFGALPFILGPNDARYVDAFFEAMSGFTTTGATVFSGLDAMPPGLLLWRSMLQWFGGIGIIVVAMSFLPELRIGGMQIFRSEAFETDGKVLPRAATIAARISGIYLILTAACFFAYLYVGLSGFHALNHALTTLSTGGFSSHDASFGMYQGPPEYVASVFMVLASLPFVRYVQLVAGTAQPLFRDSQIWAFLWTISILVALIAGYRVLANGDTAEHSFREALFNVTSIITGTGYASVDYQLWGAAPVVLFFFIGLIGGCAGSTCCSIKIFRYQLLFASIKAQIAKIHTPSGLFQPRFDGQPVSQDVLSSVMSFFMFFVISLGGLSVLLAATGLDFITSVSGAATALANIGPGLGPIIGPAGNFSSLNDSAKWLLAAAMLIGRLELLVVYALLTVRFWRG